MGDAWRSCTGPLEDGGRASRRSLPRTGDVVGQFWHVIGLHRYDVGELDALVPGLRLADDEPLNTRP